MDTYGASKSEFSLLRARAGLSIQDLSDEVGYSKRTLYRWESGEFPARRAVMSRLKVLADKTVQEKFRQNPFTFIDLFAGIGGMRRGFEAVGGECVFTCELDRYARRTYLANYSCDHDVAEDITTVPSSAVPDHDVLLAGFPCQPFSIAGVSKKNALQQPHGFHCEAQGTLFFDVARIIERRRPHAFVLENVKNLVGHDKGRTFRVIHRTLTEELGYQVHWKVIDGRYWVPQHRERIFIVGFRHENGFNLDNIGIPAEGPKLASILHPEDGGESEESPWTLGPDAKVSDKYTLSDHLWKYLQNYAAKHRAAGNGFGFGLVGPEDTTRTLSARYYKDGSEILIRQEGRNPRRLTPRECARLMGFDRPGEREFVIPVSDTQAYRQFGNAVIVPCVEAIARHMAPWIAINRTPAQLQLPYVA